MTTPKAQVRTVGAFSLNPDTFFETWAVDGPNLLPKNNDFRTSIIKTFGLPSNDDYVYHATASVTLAQVQNAINFGGTNGLHAWYLDDEGKQVRYEIISSPPRLTTSAMPVQTPHCYQINTLTIHPN